MASGIGDHPTLNLTSEEKQLFGRLFKQADTKGDGIVTGEIAISLFPKAKLSETVLGEVWAMADTENRGFLLQEDFAKAMRLIGHFQAHPERPLTNDLTMQPCPPGFPKFEGINMGPSTSFEDSASSPAYPPQGIQPQNSGSGSGRVPPLTPDRVADYTRLFENAGAKPGGTLDGDKARMFFQRSGLPNMVLAQVWNLADTEQRSALSLSEFIIAMHLLASYRNGTLTSLPSTLPAGLIEAASRRPPPAPAASSIPRQFSGQNAPRTSSPLARQAFGPPQPTASSDWLVGAFEKQGFDQLFERLDTNNAGAITGGQAVEFFGQSQLPQEILASIWDLATIRGQDQLNRDEFAVAMWLIRDQRGRPKPELPAQLPPNLIPPSLRGQVKPVQAQATGFVPPAPQKPSASDDLFGLDALSASPTQPVQQQGTGGSGSVSRAFEDPFGNKPSSPSQPSFSPTRTGPASHFKPFVPSSTFGQGLASQNTGESGTSSVPASREIKSSPSAMDDLLGDDESSKKIGNDSLDLGNIANQAGILRNQIQDIQGKKAVTENDIKSTNNQRRDLEQRLAQFRTEFEREAQAVKALEEQLNASRKETNRMQQDLALLEANYHDIQTQHQQIATALEAERRENLSLKERLRMVNTEVAKLKPELERMQNETRREKGMVSINKKQLEKSETERDTMKTEIDTLNQQVSEAATVPLPEQTSAVASPAPSTASQKTNPFFRKSPQASIDNTMAPGGFTRTQSRDSPNITNIFGPSFGGTPVTSPPATSFRGEAFPTQQEASVTSSEPGVPTPSASPHLSEAPAPPASRQITSGDLPLAASHADTAPSSVRVETPTSRYGGAETPTNAGSSSPAAVNVRPETTRQDTTSSAGAALFDRTASPIASTTSDTSRGKQGEKSDFFRQFGSAVPGAFPETHSPIVPEKTGDSAFSERSKQSAPRADPFSFPARQDTTKSDFDSAFASVGGPKAVNRQVTGSSNGEGGAVKQKFDNEFPPIETHDGEESDSDEDVTGFGDSFTQASPPRATNTQSAFASQPSTSDPPRPDAQKSPPSYNTAAPRAASNDFPPEFSGLLPSRENPLSSSAQEAPSPATTGSRGDALFGGSSTASKNASAAPTSTLSAFSGSPPVTSGTPASTTGTHSDAYHSAPTHPPTERSSASTHQGGFKDDFDAGFDDLVETRGDDDVIGDDDFVFASQHHHGIHESEEWNPTFDSPAASKTGTMQSDRTPTTTNLSQGPAKAAFDDFNGFESSFKLPPQNLGNSSSSKPISDDWDDMFKSIGGGPSDSGAASSSFDKSVFDKTFDDNEPFGAAAPPAAPMPPPAPEAPEPPKLGRTITESSVHDVDDVKKLVKMGFPRQLVVNALEKYDYDFNKAVEHLTGRS